MKGLMRFLPMFAGLGACGIVGIIGVLLSAGAPVEGSSRLIGLAALIAAFGVFMLVKSWMEKKPPQDPK